MVYFLFLLFTSSCNSDDTSPDCGCASETRTTITESANLIGEMFYNRPEDNSDNYYINQFWIRYTETNCVNCVHSMVVCKEELLGNEFEDLKQLPLGETIQVEFSGHLKNICDRPFSPGDYTYERIILTSIERQ